MYTRVCDMLYRPNLGSNSFKVPTKGRFAFLGYIWVTYCSITSYVS